MGGREPHEQGKRRQSREPGACGQGNVSRERGGRAESQARLGDDNASKEEARESREARRVWATTMRAVRTHILTTLRRTTGSMAMYGREPEDCTGAEMKAQDERNDPRSYVNLAWWGWGVDGGGFDGGGMMGGGGRLTVSGAVFQNSGRITIFPTT